MLQSYITKWSKQNGTGIKTDVPHPMEHKREPRTGTYIYGQECQDHAMETGKVSSTNGVGKIKYPYAKNKNKTKHESLYLLLTQKD